MVMNYLLLFLSTLLLSQIAPTASAPSLEVQNIDECEKCTESNCWFCESDQISSDGKKTRFCHCDKSHEKPAAGYCGTHAYANFVRYAETERECIGTAQGPGEVKDDRAEQDSAEQDSAEIIYLTEGAPLGLLVTLILIFCCIGYGSGCLCMFYLCKMKGEQEEEERRERAAAMKVVTARDAYETGSFVTTKRVNGRGASALNGDII